MDLVRSVYSFWWYDTLSLTHFSLSLSLFLSPANPACEAVGCGEWTRPMIQNPNYKGKWKPPMIDNPDYDVIPTFPANLLIFENLLIMYMYIGKVGAP